MKIYLSGKITGDENYKNKFITVEKELTNKGYEVFNPAVMPNMFSWEEFMKLDLMVLSFCDAICLLPDWKESRGAVMEYEEAKRLGLNILFYEFDKLEEKKIA